ncbi:hypothetical protein MF672_043655 [Actinomadura sp. ATCC 31491]|uniref:Uncharacterized protein n=1 Tax=Actinomadura luzonensis TaxID=2805427 RepID=A0ABT0G7U0_9ACTN|nr:hypothetical protein [Actinomadura luzonensis]MCK2220654.1 hypothetical protein [Actinomadura luzonensis]
MLAPDMPNELTPASAGPGRSGQGPAVRASSTADSGARATSYGSLTCRVRGMVRWRSASAVLSSPARPETNSVCPRLDFSEPTAQRLPGSRPSRSTASSAASSVGSPMAVPGPCAST